MTTSNTRRLFETLYTRAGYTDGGDALVVIFREQKADFVVIVPDHVDGDFIVSSWSIISNDWLAHPLHEGPLESCLEYLREIGCI